MAQTYVDGNKKSLSDFLEEVKECAERAFGDNAQHMKDSLRYAKLPSHRNRSLNFSYPENGIYDRIIAHPETQLELSGLENDWDLPTLTLTAVSPNDDSQTTDQSEILCQYCEKHGMSLEIAVRGRKRKSNKELTLRSETKNLRKLNHLYLVLNTKE